MNTVNFPNHPIMIIDDDRHALTSFTTTLQAHGITNVATCQAPQAAAAFLEKQTYAAMLLDLSMPGKSGEEILVETVAAHPYLPVIIITGMNDLETAVKCMKAGAFDYLVKPVDPNRLANTVRRAIELNELRGEMAGLKARIIDNKLDHPEAFAAIVTRNQRMFGILQYAETIAATSQPVFITGETGVGKELLAAAIHTASGRTGQFVAVNIAGLDDQLFADTLFGHTAGAFTGADRARDGLVRQAENGTLFLDEIGDLSSASQIKLLRLLQEREYYPLGADLPKRSSARVIVATNRDLQELQDGNRFRKDLFYRLQTHHIHLPPLRERRDDLPVLLRALFSKAAAALQRPALPAPPRALLALLTNYNFPGNVRELEAMVFDALSQSKSETEILAAFRQKIKPAEGALDNAPDTSENLASLLADLPTLPTLDDMRTALIRAALQRSSGNQAAAARMLGIRQQSLNHWLKNHPL